MVKVPLSNSFLERRDARRKFIESLVVVVVVVVVVFIYFE